MKLLLTITCLALTSCENDGSQPPLKIPDVRFTSAEMPTIHTDAARPNLYPTLIKDVKSGAEYLVIAGDNGRLVVVTLQAPTTPRAEKAP